MEAYMEAEAYVDYREAEAYMEAYMHRASPPRFRWEVGCGAGRCQLMSPRVAPALPAWGLGSQGEGVRRVVPGGSPSLRVAGPGVGQVEPESQTGRA